MTFTASVFLLTMGLFVGMLIFFEGGRRIGVARIGKDPDCLTRGAGAAEGAVFALLGLLMAFTFSGAASRFEARRMLINTEANAIGTVYLRIDLLPGEVQPPLRELLRRYAEIRATIYQGADDTEALQAKLATSASLQNEIWQQAMAAIRLPAAMPQAAMLMTPALNDMIDITGTRAAATATHPPGIVFVLLVVLSLIAAMLAGYATSPNKDRSWLHQVTFALVTSLAIYVIFDIEYPRLGLIRVDDADQAIIDLVKSWH